LKAPLIPAWFDYGESMSKRRGTEAFPKGCHPGAKRRVSSTNSEILHFVQNDISMLFRQPRFKRFKGADQKRHIV
jgi:hypothetical protein